MTGVREAQLRRVAETFASKARLPDPAMGQTQHRRHRQCRASCILLLATGNVSATLQRNNPFRGHDNVQGASTWVSISRVFRSTTALPKEPGGIGAAFEWITTA